LPLTLKTLFKRRDVNPLVLTSKINAVYFISIIQVLVQKDEENLYGRRGNIWYISTLLG
jgi:hypothetical protein